jgi:hypothetical protein
LPGWITTSIALVIAGFGGLMGTSEAGVSSSRIELNSSIGSARLGEAYSRLSAAIGPGTLTATLRFHDRVVGMERVYPSTHLRVSFRGATPTRSVVTAVLTRSPMYATATGVRVGVTVAELRAAAPGVRCGGVPVACQLGFDEGRAGTVFVLANNDVMAIDISRSAS